MAHSNRGLEQFQPNMTFTEFWRYILRFGVAISQQWAWSTNTLWKAFDPESKIPDRRQLHAKTTLHSCSSCQQLGYLGAQPCTDFLGVCAIGGLVIYAFQKLLQMNWPLGRATALCRIWHWGLSARNAQFQYVFCLKKKHWNLQNSEGTHAHCMWNFLHFLPFSARVSTTERWQFSRWTLDISGANTAPWGFL